MTISAVQNYRDKIKQIFTMRYNLKFRKLTFYCLTRPQSIRKSKQISGQTILSSPQDAEFNPNFAKNRDIPVVKNSVTRPVTPAVLTTDSLSTFYSTLIICQIPAYNLYYIFFRIQYVLLECVAVLAQKKESFPAHTLN